MGINNNTDALSFSNEFINLETVIYSMITILKVKI
jgi:hypothetical protein